MYGPKDNRAQKIGRAMICMDCDLGNAHESTDAVSKPVPVYDCTSSELDAQLPYVNCDVDRNSEELRRSINVQYGMWTEEDQFEYEEKKRQRQAVWSLYDRDDKF